MSMNFLTTAERKRPVSPQGLSVWSLLLLAGFFLTGAWSGDGEVRAQAASPSLEKLAIVSTQNGETKDNVFMVEVMRTTEERARGLMFRRYLPADRGMLFEFGVEAPVAMWMKDTFIPLDMLFIKKDGTILSMALNTEPHSTRTIGTGVAIWSVLELNGGTAQRLGIKPGNTVVHPLFSGK